MDPVEEAISQILGQEHDWKRAAACRELDGDRRAWFTCDERAHLVIAGAKVRGRAAHQHAANICYNCPSQWDCALWALKTETGEVVGVWSMIPRDFKWFRELPGAALIVEAAREAEVPVQVAVATARQANV